MSEATLSGSSNSHSRLAPSGSKCWTKCTMSVSYTEANRDKILPMKVQEVRKLTPYLNAIPQDEVMDYERNAARIVHNLTARGEPVSKLSKEDGNLIFKASGNENSKLGSRAHEHAAAILLDQKTLDDIPEEFRPHVKAYVDYCLSLVPDGERPFIESKVKLFYSDKEDDTGTCDFAVVTSDHVNIADLKYGAGVLVEARDNEQLAIYALSFIRAYEDLYDFHPATHVTMAIVQPRHHEGDEVKTWTLSLSELEDFCQPIHDTAIRIRNGAGLQFAPGEDACRWCDAKSFCDARREALTSGFDVPGRSGVEFLSCLPDLTKEEKKEPVASRVTNRIIDAVAGDDAGTWEWTDADLIRFWENSDNITAFLKDIDELVTARAQSGDTFGDLVKLVKGREGNWAWRDEAAADTFLKGQGFKQEDRYTQKLKSVAQIRDGVLKDKLASTARTKTRFEQLITRSPGSVVAVPVSDKREAVQSSVSFLPDLTLTEPTEP